MSTRFALQLATAFALPVLLSTPPALAVDTPHARSPQTFGQSAPLDIVLYDRTSDRTLPVYSHRGELFVAGEPGHEYEIRLRNTGDTRVLAVTSVDGINVVTGRSAAVDQPGYVIDGWSSARIDGWRKNLGEVASFYFTVPGRSYAAQTGRPDDVGVIGVAMFLEQRQFAEPLQDGARPDEAEYRQRAAESLRSEAHIPSTPPPAAAASGQLADAAKAGNAVPADRESTRATAPSLGTGHGTRHHSPVRETEFERASSRPNAVVRIYYDSWRQLVARGVVEPELRTVQHRAEPFPGGFVPDP